jgi:hypothetical protein
MTIRRSSPRQQDLRVLFIAFVEGDTEDQYLKYWAKRHRSRVVLSVDPRRQDPRGTVRNACETKREEDRLRKRSTGRPPFQVWCVFDRDEHPYLPEAFNMAADNGVRVAFSNPCLELWFWLHLHTQTAEIDRHRVQSLAYHALRCSKAALSEVALDRLRADYDLAASRAIALAGRHERNGRCGFSNPSSTLHHLVTELSSI